jgi:hypothetical protein
MARRWQTSIIAGMFFWKKIGAPTKLLREKDSSEKRLTQVQPEVKGNRDSYECEILE